VFLVTDSPAGLAAFGDPTGGGPPPAEATLPTEVESLWQVLGGGGACCGRVARSGPGDFWSCALVKNEAPASQFDVLRGQLAEGLTLPGPVACLALTGQGFHGHRGRTWQVEAGNLHLSLALAPAVPAAGLGLGLTMLPAVAVVDAIQAINGRLRPQIKWVNDILVDGRKVAGVLTATQTLGERLQYVVLGIGLNLARTPPVDVTPFVPAVGCLREFPGGEDLTLPQLFWAVLDAVAARYRQLLRDGPGPMAQAYGDVSLVLGRRVRIWAEGSQAGADPAGWPEPLAVGRVAAIGPDLRLHLEGRAEPVDRGRLAFEETCVAFGL